MRYRTLVSTDVLARHISDPNWIVIDCRFSLADTTAGEFAYSQGHIPGAYYAHLDRDLSSAITETTGRHPLPSVDDFCQTLGGWGISSASQVVVYDDANGAFAARLWWMLRWVGHVDVAVLDGGWNKWKADGWEVQMQPHSALPAMYKGDALRDAWLSCDEVQAHLAHKDILLLDARAPERYRGEVEPIDPVAGHVPGAANRPFQENLDRFGLFKTPLQLNKEYEQLIAGRTPEQVVHMCGSGVTACHNLLAMEHAELTGSKLYAGSWSEWIRDIERPVGKGG